MGIVNYFIRSFETIRNLFRGLELEEFELSPEREDELIEKIVHLVLNYGLEMPATLLLYGLEPGSTIMSQMVLLPFTPFLEVMGIQGFELVILFENKRNVQRIRNRIKELTK